MRQGISNAKAYAAKLSVNSKEFRTGTQNGKNGDDEQVAKKRQQQLATIWHWSTDLQQYV